MQIRTLSLGHLKFKNEVSGHGKIQETNHNLTNTGEFVLHTYESKIIGNIGATI